MSKVYNAKEARAYVLQEVGIVVSEYKMKQIIRSGILQAQRDPLDKRAFLISQADLDSWIQTLRPKNDKK